MLLFIVYVGKITQNSSNKTILIRKKCVNRGFFVYQRLHPIASLVVLLAKMAATGKRRAAVVASVETDVVEHVDARGLCVALRENVNTA